MEAVRLHATIKKVDMPYIERFLNGISAEEISFEEEDDFFYELSQEDLEEIRLSEQEFEMGLEISHEEVIEKIKNRRLKK